LQIKYQNIENLKPLAKLAPISGKKQNEIQAILDIYSEIKGEKNFLILFQNNLELRPGGGFIGAFGIVKIKNGEISDMQVFDTGNFDKNIPNTQTPPAPLADILGTKSWRMRGSNWSPDFSANAEKAEYFYRIGGGKENIDGVIAINTDVLNSILSITGSVKIDGYPGEYRDENAILQLEYQVEKGYLEQGIEKAERKNIMGELADILIENVRNFNFSEKLELGKKLLAHLERKDIQFFFEDENLRKKIENVNWDGRVKDFDGDYLMIIDANMNALKSDYCIRRSIDYGVDLKGENPQAVLNITYEHTCRAKDWMTTDYRSWLRVYVPAGSYLEESIGQNGDVQYSDEFGKKVFGMLIFVPVGKSQVVTLKYRLPDELKGDNYKLLVQKQSGSGETPIDISLKKPDGKETKTREILTGDKNFPL
jgi:hypothetical protein